MVIPPKQFTNWYEVLGVPPTANSTDLSAVFQLLIARFRPDNKETGDPRRLQEVKTAYEVLSNPERRKAFDHELRQRNPPAQVPLHLSPEFADEVDDEVARRLSVLCLLYNQRRSNPINPGLTIAQLEEQVGTPRDQLEFSFWYLKQKRLVLADDRSTMTIMTEGIDFIEENLRRSQKAAKEVRRPGVERAA
jgi:curved DNA-binding protein CbpA